MVKKSLVLVFLVTLLSMSLVCAVDVPGLGVSGITGAVTGLMQNKTFQISAAIFVIILIVVGISVYLGNRNNKDRKNPEVKREENPITGKKFSNPIFGKKTSNPIMNKLNGKEVHESEEPVRNVDKFKK